MKAWIADYGEPVEDNVSSPRRYLYVVAEQFASTKHADMGYPDDMEVCIRDDAGVIHTFIVEAIPSVDFKAVEVKE